MIQEGNGKQGIGNGEEVWKNFLRTKLPRISSGF
jgi:hypothetical protein